MNILKKTNKNAIDGLFDELNDIAPELGKFVVEFPYSEIYTREGLDLKTRELATVVPLLQWEMLNLNLRIILMLLLMLIIVLLKSLKL